MAHRFDQLLTERAFVLMVDGRAADWAAPPVIAGALLLDLERRGCLQRRDGALAACGCDPGDDLLARAHAAIARSRKRHDARGWVKQLPKQLGSLNEDLARRHVRRGLLVETPQKRFGLFATVGLRAPAAEPKEEFLRRLLSAFNSVSELGEDDRLLVALLFPDVFVARVPEDRRRDAANWLVEIKRGAAGGRGGIRDAVLAAVDDALTSDSVRWRAI